MVKPIPAEIVKQLQVEHKETGQVVVLGFPADPITYRLCVVRGTIRSLTEGLENLSDEEIVQVLTACGDIGKIMEAKKFIVFY